MQWLKGGGMPRSSWASEYIQEKERNLKVPGDGEETDEKQWGSEVKGFGYIDGVKK